VINTPRAAAASLDLLPSVNAGRQFGREAAFPDDRPAAREGTDAPNPLLAYFNANTEGAGIFKWVHYFDIYQRHFSKFVGQEVHVMEVGIYSGGSLKMWKHYFGPRCRVYGVDVEPACLSDEDEHTKVFIGDQADRAFWKRIKQAAPVIDILIDDGGHEPEQQRITLEEMLPHLRPNGVYFCEDIHDLHGNLNPFAAYVQGLASNLNTAKSVPVSAANAIAFKPSKFQEMIHSINLYPFVTVVERHPSPLRELVGQKHGTQWQPFLK
jgi:hypothetical protein